jgi:hypothetical protein
MKKISLAIACVMITTSLIAQVPRGAESNAALRYWNAFAQMGNLAITDAQARRLEAMADGSSPWDESMFGKLLDENSGAVETMVRGTALPYCAWGVDYALADAAPVPQVGRGRALARLNALTAARLAAQGKSRDAADHLIAGIRFAKDLSAGMPLIGVLVGKSALTSDFHVAMSLATSGQLSPGDRARFVAAVRALSPDVFDWNHAVRVEAAATHNALSRLHYSDDPAKILTDWGMHEAATKDPRPSEADIHQADEILSDAEKVFAQSPSASAVPIAQLEARIANLNPAAKAIIPSLKRTNDRRKEVEELRQKVLSTLQ